MPTKKKSSPSRIITHAAIVVDKSASMRGIWSATQRALNANIDDIFVQSTSTNRKLVRGTKLVYYPAAGQ